MKIVGPTPVTLVKEETTYDVLEELFRNMARKYTLGKPVNSYYPEVTAIVQLRSISYFALFLFMIWH